MVFECLRKQSLLHECSEYNGYQIALGDRLGLDRLGRASLEYEQEKKKIIRILFTSLFK